MIPRVENLQNETASILESQEEYKEPENEKNMPKELRDRLL
jgi:hypothetical protein